MNLRKLFDQMVKEPQRLLDSGEFFKIGFYNIIRLAAILIGLYGSFLVIGELFGGNGYIDSVTDLKAFPMTRSIVCSLFTLFISVATIAWMVGILWSRSLSFRDSQSGNILDFFPKFLRLVGEVLAVVPISAGLISFIAILMAAFPYAPIESIYSIVQDFEFIDGMMGEVANGVRIDEFDDYIESFSEGLFGLVTGAIFSFFILAFYYFSATFFELVIRFLRRS